ncbi:MAG: hypothetical protein HC904_14785 [Blastochloris sp.]|nr:hypothetical protein [Blastochloris sp.]
MFDGFFEYEGSGLGRTGERYALSDRTGREVLAWSACENHKEGRVQPGSTVMVVQASEAFSRAHVEQAPELYVPLLRKELERCWELEGAFLKNTFAHRWRYARSLELGSYPPLPAGVEVCGDGLVRSRIEDVYMSGVAAAERVLRAC